jgi:hypothetical protein
MKNLFIISVMLFFFIIGCSKSNPTAALQTATPITQIVTLTQTPTQTTILTATPSPTSTPILTATPTSTATTSAINATAYVLLTGTSVSRTITIYNNWVDVTDATVAINGITIPYNGSGYVLSAIDTIVTGSTVTLNISSTVGNFTASGVMPASGAAAIKYSYTRM